MLSIGMSAPHWTGNDQDGKPHASDDYVGKWLLLYFYPEDDTSGCTAEACGFRDAFSTLSSRISIVGVSADSVESHRKFASKYALPFTLIADPEKKISTAFGADGLQFPKRVTFLIDPKGKIEKIYSGFDPALHASTIVKDLSVLTTNH